MHAYWSNDLAYRTFLDQYACLMVNLRSNSNLNTPNLCLKKHTSLFYSMNHPFNECVCPHFPSIGMKRAQIQALIIWAVPSSFYISFRLSNFLHSIPIGQFLWPGFICFSPAELILNLTHLLVCAFLSSQSTFVIHHSVNVLSLLPCLFSLFHAITTSLFFLG